MPSPSPIAARSVSGSLRLRRGRLRSTWYAKWRDGMGEQHQDRLGLLWEDKGEPPAGYLRRKDAEAVLQALLTDARRGASEQRSLGVTFDVIAEEWLAWGVRDRDWKPSTLSDNRSVVNAHLLPAFRGRRIEKITPDDIEQWRDELIDERGVSRRTANKCLTIFGAILERAIKAHGLLRNPVREVAKLRERYDPNQYDFYSPEEIEQLGGGAGSEQDRAIFLTAAFTGLRMGELIALRWGDVDFDTEALHVYGSYSLGTLTAPKSGLTRTVPIAEQVRDLLKEHRNRVPHARSDLVFPGERGEFLDGSALRRRYKKALKSAELRPLRLPRPAPHFRLNRHQPGHDRPSPGLDGSFGRANDHEVHAPPQPSRRRATAVGGIPAEETWPWRRQWGDAQERSTLSRKSRRPRPQRSPGASARPQRLPHAR